MADGTLEFELVSPERLLASEEVAMVVVPGAEGNFGVLPRHAAMISTVRPGVIDVYKTRNEVSERIFVAGGFAEVTPQRCTVLAEHAVAVADIDRAAAEAKLKDLREDLEDAKDDAGRKAAQRQVAAYEAMIKAAG